MAWMQVVLLQLLVDVEHGVARLVEAGQQLVHDDEDVGLALASPKSSITLRS